MSAPEPGTSPAVVDPATVDSATVDSVNPADSVNLAKDADSIAGPTPTSTSAASVPPSSAPPTSSPSSPPPPRIPPAAVKTAARLDAFLVRLNKCMETPAGIDAVLAFVCYAARLGAVVLRTAAGRALLHEPVYRLAVLLASRPSIRSVFIQPVYGSSSLKTEAATAALVLAKRLGALGSLLTEARMMLRLWGLLSLYVWARSLLKQLLARYTEKNEKADSSQQPTKVQALLGWTQLLSCIGYQAAENVAYLSARGVLGASPAAQAALYLWSSRSFSVYVAVELARGAYDIVHHGASDTPEKRAAAVELHRNFARYASLAPVMGHWSVQKGFLSEAGLSIFGFIPAALQIHKIWGDV